MQRPVCFIEKKTASTHREIAPSYGCLETVTQSRVNAFWTQWKRDYVVLLHNRQKWRDTRRDIAVDDLVLLVDDNVRRGEWRMGRVISTEGSGRHIRRAQVKRVDGRILFCDRSKIVHLELDLE